MEKKFNWLGWLIILILAILDTLLFIVGIVVWNNSNDIGILIIACSTAVMAIGAGLTPRFYDWTLGILLPIQKCTATVVWLEDSYITFDLTNGDRIAFKVPVKKYYTILIGESGLLTYKQQGKHTYFISFERNKRF